MTHPLHRFIVEKSGTVKAVKVEENQKVSSGKVLLTLKDTSAEVNYATLLREREEYEETLLNLIRIYKEGAVYAREKGLITAITETEDGTATTTALSSGQSGSVSTTTASSDEADGTVFSICPTDEMTLTLSVDETDILALSVGQEAQVTIDSLGEETFTGTLTELSTVGSSADGVTTYSATVTMKKVNGMLEGMSASAVIAIEGKENALLVPSHKTSTNSYVYTSYDEETGELGGRTEVVTGLSDGTNTEITEGLSEGDSVCYTEKEENNNPFGGGFPGGGFGDGARPGGMPGGGPSGMGPGATPGRR